jgi:hypothetical protein
MANEKTSLFPLPPHQVIETVYVKLADGRIVARTPDELASLPADQTQPQIVAKSNA